ncbi:MAG: hypothetical protein OMM_04635 [Candidatus Magnetoglobus multicellularis str. Araruama]|uniref:Uncharacterized protein n=1 Tax=Candidatus Magnetoglobus multicellularis str. Araruama TaxID=890399 RepID=A0A1V1P0G5_9BACT|nr:MAG: hypothetical protein OMM_04635 [Candidatus Magnetoglobus multicellularis str. Araruama]
MKKSSENQGQLSLHINGKSYSETRLLNQTFNTNTLGQVEIIVSGVKGENEGLVDIELSVGALGYTAVQDFQLKDSGYTVQFVEPIDDQITYMVGEAPVQLTVSSSQDSTLIFSTSLGYFTNGEKTQAVKCDPSGLATTTFQALAAGLASIQVYDQQNTSISDDLKIAIAQPKEKAAQLTLQANPKVIGISTQAKKEKAEIIATVLTSDDSGNDNSGSQVVGNATVVFPLQVPLVVVNL